MCEKIIPEDEFLKEELLEAEEKVVPPSEYLSEEIVIEESEVISQHYGQTMLSMEKISVRYYRKWNDMWSSFFLQDDELEFEDCADVGAIETGSNLEEESEDSCDESGNGIGESLDEEYETKLEATDDEGECEGDDGKLSVDEILQGVLSGKIQQIQVVW